MFEPSWPANAWPYFVVDSLNESMLACVCYLNRIAQEE
jgi:hypothetical protein